MANRAQRRRNQQRAAEQREMEAMLKTGSPDWRMAGAFDHRHDCSIMTDSMYPECNCDGRDYAD